MYLLCTKRPLFVEIELYSYLYNIVCLTTCRASRDWSSCTAQSTKVKQSRYTSVSDLPNVVLLPALTRIVQLPALAIRTVPALTRTIIGWAKCRIGLGCRPVHVGLNPRPVWPFSTVQAGWMRWQLKKATLEEYVNRFVFITLYYYINGKITTFRICFPCRRHNRYFNFATLGV